jgi:hypothetical protein
VCTQCGRMHVAAEHTLHDERVCFCCWYVFGCFAAQPPHAVRIKTASAIKANQSKARHHTSASTQQAHRTPSRTACSTPTHAATSTAKDDPPGVAAHRSNVAKGDGGGAVPNPSSVASPVEVNALHTAGGRSNSARYGRDGSVRTHAAAGRTKVWAVVGTQANCCSCFTHAALPQSCDAAPGWPAHAVHASTVQCSAVQRGIV